jgi:hypothetical protein
MGRSGKVETNIIASWKEEEQLALCKAWVSVSENPLVGTEMKADTFWAKIKEQLKSARTTEACRGQWSDIQWSVQKFVGCFAKIESMNPSGTTFEQRVRYIY